VSASINIPGSKSFTNRALICAALARGESAVRKASDSDDTALMANGLNQLGVLVRKLDDSLIVAGTGGRLYAPRFPIPVGNAGTTLRFLLSLAAVAQGDVVFEAHQRMAERPISDLVEGLRSLGTHVDAPRGVPRYKVRGGSFHGGEVRLRGEKSSQFLSSLLMVSPYAVHDVEILIEGEQTSLSYVDMTLDVMRHFGIEVENFDYRRFLVKADQRYRALEFLVEPDASGASYFLAAAVIAGGDVLVKGLRGASRQGDARFIRTLGRMGCTVAEESGGVRIRRGETLRGLDIDMNSMPDVVPTLAVVALFADGDTHIRNVAQLKYKESDRLQALATELRKLGAQVSLRDDGIDIHPVSMHGAQLDTYNDHRLAMSFSLIGLRVPGVRIENPECVKKSFPRFWDEFEKFDQRHPRNIDTQESRR
jgi:3-phosphoshikimate 1-carboxyvinyltransferase